jgi:ureidoacrylate peracid hydrolase
MAERAAADPMLPRILSPQWAAVLVLDVQNDFCHERGAMGRLGFDMGPIQSSVYTLAQFVESARLAEIPVIFIATQHSETTNS